jgi:hypothetical protein
MSDEALMTNLAMIGDLKARLFGVAENSRYRFRGCRRHDEG